MTTTLTLNQAATKAINSVDANLLSNGSEYISSSMYRKILDLISKLVPDLISRIHQRGEDGARKEKNVFYLLTMDNGNATLCGYVVESEATAEATIAIDAEREFVFGNGFWVGTGPDLFTEFTPGGEKKSKLLWAASYERTLAMPLFYVDTGKPLITIFFSEYQLYRLAEDQASKHAANFTTSAIEANTAEAIKAPQTTTRIHVGTVDENGNMVATDNQDTASNQSSLKHHVVNTPQEDQPNSTILSRLVDTFRGDPRSADTKGASLA